MKYAFPAWGDPRARVLAAWTDVYKRQGRLLVDGWFGPYADEPTIASVAVRDWQRPVESEHAANVAREFVAADR